MTSTVTLIGFGEAGRAFAPAGARAFDCKAQDEATRADMLAAFAFGGVQGFDVPVKAMSDAKVVLCLVTADQAVAAARDYASLLPAGALWLDMNSVSPGSKRQAAELIEAAGGRYADVAVMAPVLPQRHGVPLLVAGPHADAAVLALQALGFANVSVAGENVGDASAIKMIRSVMVKGLEALTTECALAAERAGVTDAVIASLDGSWKQQGWGERFDYNLDRVMAHGLRRAAEMEEVAITLSDLGVEPVMTRGTIERQRAIGTLAVAPPEGLAAKLAAIQTPEPARTA